MYEHLIYFYGNMLIETKQPKELGTIPLLYGLRHLVWNPERKEVYVAYTELLALANIEIIDMSSNSATISQWENIIPGIIGPTFSGIWQSFLASLGTSLLLTTEI